MSTASKPAATDQDAGRVAPFAGLLVVETGTGLAAPLVTRLMADLGADVLKIESAGKPDINRDRVPPPGVSKAEIGEAYPAIHETNAGKRGISLNLKSEGGRGVFLDLLRRADVYVESYSPGWLERLGMSLEAIQEANPRLIVVAQSAYGQEGPGRGQRAYAPVMTALAGVEGLLGYPDGRVVPQISSAIGDVNAASFSVLCLTAALLRRSRTGRGCLVDFSQIEAAACIAGVALAEQQLTGHAPGPVGNRRTDAAPHGLYPTAGDDEWIAVTVADDAQWAAACAVLGVDDELRAQTASTADRVAAVEELDATVAAATRERTATELVEALQAAGVPCAPVLDCYSVDEHPHFDARALSARVEHPAFGEMRLTSTPWHIDGVPVTVRGPAPGLGAHTTEVLRDVLGLDERQIADLQSQGALS
jgi:crotonobetainyl-CoA:carnitine CoA-transferase CaiB-like acyl-CoA transferase